MLGPSTIQSMHVADSYYSPYIKNVDIQETLILRMIKLVYFYIVSFLSTLEKTFLLEEKTTVNSQQLFSHMVRDDIFFEETNQM